MANRRFETHEHRHVIHRMRLGESDRAIAKSGLMGRLKCAQLREIAIRHEWLGAALYMKALERAPENFRTHAMLAGVYSMMGRDKEARAEAAEVLRINPKFSLEWYARTSAYKDGSVTDKIINDMRKAGLPDKPPPAQP